MHGDNFTRILKSLAKIQNKLCGQGCIEKHSIIVFSVEVLILKGVWKVERKNFCSFFFLIGKSGKEGYVLKASFL